MSISTMSTPSTERDLVLPSLILSANSPSVKTAMPATGQLVQRAGNVNSGDRPIKEVLSFALNPELYNSWCSIGNIRNLSAHSQIAEFLISFYKDQEKWKTRENCRTCGSDLTLHCPHCLTNHSTQVMESSNKTQEKQQVETMQGLLHTVHQLDKNESEKNHNNSKFTVKIKQEPVKGLSPVEEDHDCSSFQGASPNYDSDVIDKTLIKFTPACDIISGPVEVPAELINVAGKKVIERSTQEKVIQQQNKLKNLNTSLDKVPNASAHLSLNPFSETSICQKLSEDSQSKQNPVQTLSLPKASISLLKASNCLTSPGQAVKRAINRLTDTKVCEGPSQQKQIKLTLLKNDLSHLPDLHTRKAASALDPISVRTLNNSVEGQLKHTAGKIIFMPVNSIPGQSPESQVMVCSKKFVQGQQNLKQVASPENGAADVLPQLLATDGQVTNSKIGTGKLNQEKLNQNQFKISTLKNNNFISAQALKAANTKIPVHDVDNMPVQGQPNNPVKMNTKVQTQVQPNNPVKITTPVQAQHNNPVKMNTPLQLQPQSLMKINTVQDQSNNPVKINTPLQEPPNKPIKINTSLKGQPNNSVKINTPVQAPLNNPVMSSTPGQTLPNKLVKINTPVQGQPNNSSPYKPVKITTPVQTLLNNQLNINTPVQEPSINPVNINTPLKGQPNNCIKIKTPVQVQPNNPVMINTAVQGQLNNPVVISTPGEAPANNSMKMVSLLKKNVAVPLSNVQATNTCNNVSNSKVTQSQTKLLPINLQPLKFVTKEKDNIVSPQMIPATNSSISNKTNGQTAQTPMTMILFLKKLDSVQSVNAVTNPVRSPCVQSVNAVTNPVPSPCVRSVNAVTNPVPSSCIQGVNAVTNPAPTSCVQSVNAVTNPVSSPCVPRVNAVSNTVPPQNVLSVNTVCNQVGNISMTKTRTVHRGSNSTQSLFVANGQRKITSFGATAKAKYPYKAYWRGQIYPQRSSKGTYDCMICSRSYHTQRGYRGHNDQHRGNLTCCPVCKKKFSTLTAMKKHQNVIHGGHRPFKCDQCGKAFGTASVLKEHKLVHGDATPYSCFCGKSFKTTMRLKAHSKAVHTSSNHMCEVCGKAFKLLKNLEQHRKALHQELKSHSCEFCGKLFAMEKSLIRHRSKHTWEQQDKKSRKVMCETCGKLYPSDYINKHKRMHTGEKPYSCGLCAKSFAYLSSYYEHMRVHKGERPFKCEVCGKCFGKSTNLARHRPIHHGSQKVFQCPVCLKVIKSHSNFRRHVQIHKAEEKPLEQVASTV